MRVALPLFGRRISPRCSLAEAVLLVLVRGAEVVERLTAELSIPVDRDLPERLHELGVDLLVCGGIDRDTELEILASGIRVIGNVAGEVEEVLDILRHGRLRPGYGFGRCADPTPEVDCMACLHRECREGLPCPGGRSGKRLPISSEKGRRFLDVAADLSAEPEPRPCRIAELVHFGLALSLRRIGIAFCVELFPEVETLSSVLSRFFDVVPVCCRAGREAKGAGDPAHMAQLLSDAGTELNVLAGLCLGCDIVFTGESRTPVTTLFVKDRSLRHNPIEAIYTRYQLVELTSGPTAPARKEHR